MNQATSLSAVTAMIGRAGLVGLIPIHVVNERSCVGVGTLAEGVVRQSFLVAMLENQWLAEQHPLKATLI